MISRTAEYAIRAAVYLAAHPGENTADAIAAATGVPPRYLAKVLGALTRAGIFQSRRGPGGGFGLARHPDDISLCEIVESNESVVREVAGEAAAADVAPEVMTAMKWLEGIESKARAALQSTTLAGLCRRADQLAVQVNRADLSSTPNP